MKATNQEMHPLFGLAPDDAVDMLIADHKRVAKLFAEFKRMTDDGDERNKATVVASICEELSIHAQLEEELFYPAVRATTGDEDHVDEALVEHASAKRIIAQLQGAAPDADLYDAMVTVLGEQINHHVEEEEGSLFPKARHAGVDTKALGATMLARKAELQGGAAVPRRPPAPRVREIKAAMDEAHEKTGKKAATRVTKKAPPSKKKLSKSRSKRR